MESGNGPLTTNTSKRKTMSRSIEEKVKQELKMETFMEALRTMEAAREKVDEAERILKEVRDKCTVAICAVTMVGGDDSYMEGLPDMRGGILDALEKMGDLMTDIDCCTDGLKKDLETEGGICV